MTSLVEQLNLEAHEPLCYYIWLNSVFSYSNLALFYQHHSMSRPLVSYFTGSVFNIYFVSVSYYGSKRLLSYYLHIDPQSKRIIPYMYMILALQWKRWISQMWRPFSVPFPLPLSAATAIHTSPWIPRPTSLPSTPSCPATGQLSPAWSKGPANEPWALNSLSCT